MVQFYRQLVLEIVLQAPSSNITVFHWVKSIRIWSFPGPYFPAFGLNTGKYGPEKLRKWTLFCPLFTLYFTTFVATCCYKFYLQLPFLWENHLWKVDAYFCIYDQLIGALNGSKGLKNLILHVGCITFFP